VRRITTLACSTAMLAATGWIASAHAQAAAPDTSAPAATDTSTPAAAPAPAKHHHMTHKTGMAPKPEAGDAAVDDLNAKSLDDAKAGKSFAPPTPTPAAKPMAKPMHHHHMAKKAAEAPAADAPAPDAAPK
jgi:hypothetical protein